MRNLRIRHSSLVLAALLLGACALPTAQPAAEVTVTQAENAQINAEWRGDVLIVDVRSKTGIGSAQVSLPPDAAQRDLILRMHLRGLENLTFSYAAGTVQVAVASSGEPLVRESFAPAAEVTAQPIARGSAQWMNVGILSNNPAATPSIPLEDGHFDVSAPPDFLSGGHTDFTLSWVDFYR
jgi:hypothetical protein